jgi:hypothetical protein
MSDYITPKYKEDAFNCPHCNAYSQQIWFDMAKVNIQKMRGVVSPSGGGHTREYHNGKIYNLQAAHCTKCENYSFWLDEKMIYPKLSVAPLPIDEMPEDVKEDFNEARTIVNDSPRAAAALLRLAIEKLLPQIGAEGKTIDQMIGYMVREKNLPVRIQKALDSLRVIGNEAVHPGELDLKDDINTALALFRVLNVIVHEMIIQPKEIDELYEMIPESKKTGINNRDKKVP